jgi:hypothetical protein
MRRTAAFLIAILMLVGNPLAAQSENDWKTQALFSIITYRMSVLGDTVAKFDGCSLARALEAEPENVAAPLPEAVRGMIAPCSAVAERGTRKVVQVDSLRHGPNADGTAYVTVVLGEWVHREDYFFVPGPRAAVREVRLWGAIQSYPRRPRRN